MRIGELSRRTGVPVPTIKYYLREDLLPPGELTSPNQASYTEAHERRLRLVRALVEVGALSIVQVRDVLAAVDTPDRPVHHVLGMVQESITTGRPDEDDAAWQAARRDVEQLIARRGWHAHADSAPGRALTAVIVSMRELGHTDFLDVYDTYAAACEPVARADIAYIARSRKLEDVVEGMVVGTVLGDAALTAIRRLAHQAASHDHFKGGPATGDCPTAPGLPAVGRYPA